MAIRIKARSGESAEQMLRRFKKMCEKEKPSERRRRAQRKSAKRMTVRPR